MIRTRCSSAIRRRVAAPATRRLLGCVAAIAAVLASSAALAPAAVGTGPTYTTPPTVLGTPAQGERLTGLGGLWTGVGAMSYAYQWYRCGPTGAHCTSIHGAIRPRYTQSAKDVGQLIGFEITATDKSGEATAYASLVGPIVGTPPLLVPTAQPMVSGTPVQGQKLTVSTGTWSPAAVAFTYAWQRCNSNGRLCTAIAGATNASYTVTAGDIGDGLLAIVQATVGRTTQATWSTVTTAAVAKTGPSNSILPAVTGTAQEGRQLTATSGAWTGSGALTYAYQWYRCDPTGAHCNSIHGARSVTYTLVAKDVAQTLALTVRATDTTGTTSAYASITGPVAAKASPLAATVQPALVAGSPAQGQVLAVSSGAWSTTPSAYAYAWQRCNPNGRVCVPIAGATNATYTVAPADVGHALLAIVRATAGSTTQAAWSTATAAALAKKGPTNSKLPTVSGTAQEGKQLTAASGAWRGSGAITYAYQWYRCGATGAHCNSIHGATGSGYTLGAKDVAQTLALTVYASDKTGTAAAYAAVTGPIATKAAALAATAQPTVSGAAIQDQLLTVAVGAWSTAPTSFTYAWQRCNPNGRICAAIAGATNSTYTVAAADVGHAVVAIVQATAGTAAQAAWSTATSAIVAKTGPTNSALPAVTGTAQEGKQLTATTGTWTGTGTITYAYQWYRCSPTGAQCASIHGATGATYTLAAKDAAQTMALTVHATDTTGTASAHADVLGPIAGKATTLVATAQPAVSGSAVQGQLLTVSVGTWSTTPASYTYAWQRCNANGRICTPIAAATSSTYTVTAADAGHALVAIVQATAGGTTQAAWSTASATATAT